MTVKISIITPTYNSSRFIRDTISSVLSQTYTDFEYIIIDDCSSDDTVSRIRFLQNEKNLWIVWSRNRALKLVKWEYICFLDHDDLWSNKEKLQKQIDYLEKHQDAGLVWSYCDFIDVHGTVLWSMKYEISDENIRKKILKYNQFCTCAVMFRASLLKNTGFLDKQYDKVDDYDLWLKIGRYAHLHNIPEVLVQYRKTGVNTSRSNKTFFIMKKLHLQLIFKNRKFYPNVLSSFIFASVNLLIPYRVAEILRSFYLKLFA